MMPVNRVPLADLLRKVFPLDNRRMLSLDGFRRAGVLVPVVMDQGDAGLLLTKRTDEVETHKGQISFPGGAADAGDADIVQTALREAEEELGIDPSGVEVLGLLDDLATPTGFCITPVLALMVALPPLKPNPMEVAEAFVIPVSFFLNPENGRVELRQFRGEEREVWFYGAGDRLVWGATAMIIRSLLVRLDLR